MFERYTERARRVVFFARYEASRFGSPKIDTEHLLLGLLREEKLLCSRWLPGVQPDVLQHRIETQFPRQPSLPTNVDLPLSKASKQVLDHAKDEADRLNSKHIGSEHLLLGLLQEDCGSTAILCELGADLNKIRLQVEQDSLRNGLADTSRQPSPAKTVTIHGTVWSADYIDAAVRWHRRYNWHWRKAQWAPSDMVVELKTGKISLDLSLAADSANFELIKDGWKKDHCIICWWALFESTEYPDHATGYTNGRDWLCAECFEKFWQRPDFISSSYSDLT